MTKIITDRDWDEIWAENYRNAEILSESNSFERTFKIDVVVGEWGRGVSWPSISKLG